MELGGTEGHHVALGAALQDGRQLLLLLFLAAPPSSAQHPAEQPHSTQHCSRDAQRRAQQPAHTRHVVIAHGLHVQHHQLLFLVFLDALQPGGTSQPVLRAATPASRNRVPAESVTWEQEWGAGQPRGVHGSCWGAMSGCTSHKMRGKKKWGGRVSYLPDNGGPYTVGMGR